MTALPGRRRKFRNNFRIRRRPNSSSFLVIVLTLIVLVETVLLLSLIPKRRSEKETRKAKKVISSQVRETPTREPARETLPKIETVVQEPIQAARGRIAIVIDDWGYNKNNLDILREINEPLTLAILPFRDFSRDVSEFAHKYNYEVIIHMPMEPEDKDNASLEPKTLMTDMDKSTITSMLNNAFDNVEYAKGINNHMGSLATKDKRLLSIVFKELKKRRAYFLDSYVVSDSIAYKVAKEIGVKFAKRSVFLDNESDFQYIRNQLYQLANDASKNGQAIGIGHDKRLTLLVLQEEIPKLTKLGYKFVFVSELVE